MKSISLKNIEDLLTPLTIDDYNNYKVCEDECKHMWVDQTQEFWIKFAVTIRTNVKNTCNKYYDDQCEKELITFLKSLTHKNYVEINNYIKNSHDLISQYKQLIEQLRLKYDELNEQERADLFSQLRVMNLKLKCSGCFVGMLSKFKCAEDGSNFEYTPPEAWLQPVTSVEPFESFLRSKWGGFKNVEDILGCKKEEIKWWKSPAQKNKPKCPIEQAKPENKKIKNFLVPEDYQLQGMEFTGKSPENRLSKWQTRCWLPRETTVWQIFGELSFEIKHSDYQWKQNPLFKLWPLLEYSFPPILHEKFFKIDAALLNDGDGPKFNIGVATWFIQYVESFGNRYMNFIQQGRDNLATRSAIQDPNHRKKLLEDWKLIRNADTEILKNVLVKPGAPNILQHSAIDPEDFLTEPCVLIQLPWQPVLLRQWLATALIEIMKFELESVELRHWPLSKDLEPIARELLTMVGDAKERILLGWSVLSFEATTYPKSDKKHPAFILDEVVIPSVNVLAFLCSGNAKTMVQSIKHLSWMTNTTLENKTNLPKNAYCINEILNGFAVLYFGHYTFWKQYNSIRDPFPTVQLTCELGLAEQLQQIIKDKVNEVPPENVPFHINELNIEEERIFTILQKASQKIPLEYTHIENLLKTRTVLEEAVIKCGHFSQEKLDTLLPMLNSDIAKVAATNIFEDIEEKKTPLQQIILSSVIYHDINKYIASIFGQTSILSWLVRLSAKITEREQLVRIIAACSVILQESPKMCGNEIGKCPAECNITENKFMDKPEMSAHMKEVRETQQLEDRNTLFAIFPEDWQEDIDPDPCMPDASYGYKIIVSALEIRVGRIIWNAAKQNFIEHAKGGEAYPDTLIVQYVLPCYISLLLDLDKYPDTDKNKIKKLNLYHVLHNIVKFYEGSYERWVQDSRPRNPPPQHPIPSFNPEEMKRKRTLASYYLESTSQVLHAYTGLGRLGFGKDKLRGFHMMCICMLDYPIFENLNSDIKSKIEIYICQSWMKDIYPHTQLLHKVSFQALRLPSPNGLLNCPALQELYTSSLIMHQLEVISSINQSQYPDILEPDSNEHLSFLKFSEALRIWRYTLYCIIFETEKNIKYPEKMLQDFITSEGKLLILQIFNHISMIREILKMKHKKVQKIEIFSFNENFFKKYNDMYFNNNLNALKLFKDYVITQGYNFRRQLGDGLECSGCSEKETNSKEFYPCKLCIQENVQDVRYFCCKACRVQVWTTTHMEEHLKLQFGI